MSLRDIDFNSDMTYDSDVDDIVNDFYIPVLSESVEYYRRSGFFSSSSLAVVARGIGEFIRNDGKMKLICNIHLSQLDADSLKKAQENPLKFLEESSFRNDLKNIEDDIVRDHVEALGWMLANGFLEIKIAFTKSEFGIYHPKVGVFKDSEENSISFIGSENASFNGLLHNIEEFRVDRSWSNDIEKQKVYRDLKKFNQEWNGNTVRTTVVDLPQAIKDDIIEYAPHEKADLALLKKSNSELYKKSKKLLPARDYQDFAVKSWFDHECKGIFNMATGSGKTITALNCYKELKERVNENFLTLVVCPQQHLVAQWEEEIGKFFDNVILSTVGNPNWKIELRHLLGDFQFGNAKFPFILTTHKNFASHEFIEIMDKREFNVFILVDEVHGVGSSTQQDGLLPKYKYRLGLSATPERWFDDEGTNALYEYFGDSVYEFSLKDAQKRGFLTKYYYCPRFVELSVDEYEEYLELTKRIAIKYNNNKNLEDISLTSDYIKRQAIIDNANSKFSELKKILNEELSDDVDHLLVYCASKNRRGKEKQIDVVNRILNNNDIIPHKFTGEEPMPLRKSILNDFTMGNFKALTAMKCLDEGVDIPSAKIAILIASTSNPREHIQRRGRLLRRSPGKDFAIIYDMIVLPNFKHLTKSERNIVQKELDRYKEFMNDAENDVECNEKLMKWMGLYGE